MVLRKRTRKRSDRKRRQTKGWACSFRRDELEVVQMLVNIISFAQCAMPVFLCKIKLGNNLGTKSCTWHFAALPCILKRRQQHGSVGIIDVHVCPGASKRLKRVGTFRLDFVLLTLWYCVTRGMCPWWHLCCTACRRTAWRP